MVLNPTGRYFEVYKTTINNNWEYPEDQVRRFTFKEKFAERKTVIAYLPGEKDERKFPLILKKYFFDVGCIGFQFLLDHEEGQFNFYLFY